MSQEKRGDHMPWDLDNDRPIYLQLMERIQQGIIAGIYKPGDKLPSVRDLAVSAGSRAERRRDQRCMYTAQVIPLYR